MSEVTSKDIKAAIGIENAATLTRWHRLGLIPEPEIRKQADNKGKISYWPTWVLHRCIRIKILVNDGWRLKDIKEKIGDWEIDKAKYERSFGPSFDRAERNAAYWNLEESVCDRLREIISHLSFITKNSKQTVLDDEFIERVIPLLREGLNPVLVVSDRGTHLTTDFMVSDYLARHRDIGESIIVMPIGRELTSYLQRTEQLPPRPWVRPSDSVVASTEEGKVQLTFWAVDKWGFEISDKPKPDVKPGWGQKK